jgi:putative ABC transport system permease protein
VTFTRLIAMALASIRRNAARAMLAVLGVVIGVGAVVVMVAIGKGAEAEVAARIAELGTNLVVVTPGATARTGVSGGAGSMDTLTVDDVAALQRESLHADAVTPVLRTFSMAVNGNSNWRTPIHGVDASWFAIRNWDVVSGRAFEEQDIRVARKVVILGQTVRRALYGEEDPVGRTLRLRGVPLEIVGLLAAKGQSPDGADSDDVAVLPYTTVRARMAGRQWLAQVLVRARSPHAVDDTIAEVTAILRETHRLGASTPDDFTVRDQREVAEAAAEATKVMTTLLLVVASVSLVVGGIGIMNIMLVSVTERTREIGIRRALGARRSDILAQFLVEAVVLTGSGGAIGALLGVGVTALVSELTGWATEVAPASVLVAVGFSAGVGVFFGWYPARRAAGLDPIEALRSA